MPGYFQNMPVVGKAVRPNPENAAELKAVEAEIDEKIAQCLANGKPDEAMNEKGQLFLVVLPLLSLFGGILCRKVTR